MDAIRLLSRFGLVLAITGLVAACGGGDINISPSTADNSVDNSSVTNNTTTPDPDPVDPDVVCASRLLESGQEVRGDFRGNHCYYSRSFADAGTNIKADILFSPLDNDGAHIFEGSLFIGENCSDDQCLADKGLRKGGDGPTLTIEAGATLAWQSNKSFLIVNRGSLILARGREDAPITLTSESDVDGTLTGTNFNAVQQWGGVVMNGFAITNKCDYEGASRDSLTTSDCHVSAEGAAGLDESHYGGDRDDDSSGVLQYVRVKHTGAEVANGDELNGISFGGVGSGTVVENLQVYSTYDDGIEMFGGSFDITNFLGMYVRDDSIDIDEGYNGTITNALVIQAEDIGNHCIESDGLGSYSSLTDEVRQAKIGQGVHSAPTIENLTCIVSPSAGQGNFDPGAGWRLREGIHPTITNAMVVSAKGADSDDNNYCVRVDHFGVTQPTLKGVVFACQDKVRSVTEAQVVGLGESVTFANITGVTDPSANADTDLQLLEGMPQVYSLPYASMQVGGANLPAGYSGGNIGGVTQGAGADWTQNWTFGLHQSNEPDGQHWFEQ